MDKRVIILLFGTDVLLMLISFYAIYHGISEGITIVWMIGIFLLIIAFIRPVIFMKNFRKHGDE